MLCLHPSRVMVREGRAARQNHTLGLMAWPAPHSFGAAGFTGACWPLITPRAFVGLL